MNIHQASYIGSIINSHIEKTYDIFPIQNKYIRYKQINEYTVPYICKLKGLEIEDLQANAKNIIKEQELFRSTFVKSDKGDIQINIHTFDECHDIPFYQVMVQSEFDQLIYDLGQNLMDRETFGNPLYNICFIDFHDEFYFYGIFSHLLFDGSFSFEKYLYNPLDMPQCTVPVFDHYLTCLHQNCKTDFTSYMKIKGNLVDNYLEEKVISDSFELNINSLYKKTEVTIEEFWIMAVYKALFKTFNHLERIPLSILTNGRKFDNILFSKDFGDFHDEIILLSDIDSVNSFNLINEYRDYRKKPYSNSKAYSDALNSSPDFSQFIEPFILLITGDHPDRKSHDQLRTKSPKNNKQYVLSIKVVVSPNLKNYTIMFRYSSKLEQIMKDFVQHLTYESEQLIKEL